MPALAVVGLSALVMLTESLDVVQLPFEMLHNNLFVPALNPVMVVLARVESANIAVPDSTVHLPVPEVGVLPARVALVPHTVWSEPALAVVGAKLIVRFVLFADPVVAGVLDTTLMRYCVPATDGKATLLVIVPADTEVNVPIFVGVVNEPVLFESCASLPNS